MINYIEFKMMYATTTVNAPRGVTRIASVNAYAAKFAISPIIIRASVSHVYRTGDTHSRPPCEVLEVLEPCIVSIYSVKWFYPRQDRFRIVYWPVGDPSSFYLRQ